MKNFFQTIGLLILLAGFLPAQTSLNVYKIFDGTTEATLRPYGQRDEGIYMCFRPELIRGLKTVDGWSMVCQDQNALTSEKIVLEIRRGDGEGTPGVTTADIIWSASTTLNFGTTAGPAAGSFTITPFKPVILPKQNDTYWIGTRFPTNSTWPTTDGVSIHGSCTLSTTKDCQEAPLGMDQFKGELCGYIDFSQTTPVSGNWNNVAIELDISFSEPVVQGYAFNNGYNTIGGTVNFCTPGSNPGTPAVKAFENFGYAGVWPDIADSGNKKRWDGFGWEVRANSLATNGGLAFLFMSDQTFDPGFIPIGYGTFFLSPATRFFNLVQLFAPLKVNTTNIPPTASANFGPFSLGPANDPARHLFAGMIGPLHVQGLVVDMKNPTTNIRLTNMTTINFAWTGKKTSVLNATTPSLSLVIPVNAKKFHLHSLRGGIDVQAEAGGNPVGPKATIDTGCTKVYFVLPPGGKIKVNLQKGEKGALVDYKFY